MQQLIIQVKDASKQQFLLTLLQEFDFVEIVNVKEFTPEKEAFVEGLRNALEEVDEHLKGKKSLQTANEFLNEL